MSDGSLFFSAGIISLSALASHSSKIAYVKDTNIAGRVYNYFEPEKLDSLAKVCERNPKKFLYEAHDNINTIVKNKRFDYVLSDNDAYWYLIDKKCNVVTKINSITNKEEGMVLHTDHGNLWQDENAKANLEHYVQTVVLPPENFLDIFRPPKCILRQR